MNARDDTALALGLNTHAGQITYGAVAESFPDLTSTTLDAVQTSASRHARAGAASTIGTRSTSGGIGKKLLSAKATTASHSGARGLADRASTRS